MLATMVVNRPLKRQKVELFAQAMREGVFDSLNGETLIVNEAGNLEDGQHRLTAFVESGIDDLYFFVVRGVKEGAGQTVDQGTSRSPADIAAMIGYQNTRTVMAAVRWLWVYENDWPAGLNQRGSVPTKILLEFLKEQSELVVAVSEVCGEYAPVARLMTSSVAAFVRLVTDRLSVPHSKEFFDALKTGETTGLTRQTRNLRDKLLGRHSKTGRLRGQEIIVLTARCWNAYREGRDLTKLFITKENDNTFRTAPRFK
jgi:hypothetical protein